jgi:hypothetical protein
MTTSTDDDDAVARELSWTSWGSSCKNPAVTPDDSLRQCRRLAGHPGDCASGFGTNLRRWVR